MLVIETSGTKTYTERLQEQSFGFWLLVAAGLFAVAQVARGFVIATDRKIFLNEKFAFSLNAPSPLMYGLYLLAMVFIGHYLITHWQRMFALSKLGFLLIITGGASNIIERTLTGKVVDYFFIANGVLNLADFYILIGIILIFAQRGYREA